MGYSSPIDKEMDKEELKKNIFFHPTIEDAIPYVTSYYKKDWGFCIDQQTFKTMPSGKYRAYINSSHKKGELTICEAVIKGKKKKEVFFSTYLCHPSMANNELSGPVLASQLMSYVKGKKNLEYTYRFVILAETIGSIAYLTKKMEHLKTYMKCGFNLTCVGDERMYSSVHSRIGNNEADIALRAALLDKSNKIFYGYEHRGSDERQYCAPGVDLPVCTFCKSKFGEYPEYHSSKDNFELVTAKGLAESYAVMTSIIDAIEFGGNPKVKTLCEPQLGKRGLYPTTSKLYKGIHPAKIRMDIISECDGTQTIFEISTKLGVGLEQCIKELKILLEHNVICVEKEKGNINF